MKKLRLHMNELPYLPPENVLSAARKGLEEINRYADPETLDRLRSLLAQYSGVDKKSIIIGPGSDMLLREITHLFSKDRNIVMISPTFLPTVKSAKQSARKLTRIRMRIPDFAVNLDLLIKEIQEPSLLIIDNPNNPTGKILLDDEAVKQILKAENLLFVIDEAYYEFSGITFTHMIEEYPNMAISRSMDKAFSLAGARIGYLIAGDIFLEKMLQLYAYLPQSSLYAAIAALQNPDYMKKNVSRIIDERERIFQELKKRQIDVFNTSTNFILIKTNIPDMAVLLKDSGILISDVSSQLGDGFIRVSIGLPEENNLFLAVFDKINKINEINMEV